MQHLPNGWAVGATGYWYEQLGDDSGTGAVKTRAALLTDSLRAVAFGIGPLATYSGEFLGQSISLKAMYISEFSTKRAFEKDDFWLNVTASFCRMAGCRRSFSNQLSFSDTSLNEWKTF